MKIKDDGVRIISESFKFLTFNFIILEISNVFFNGYSAEHLWANSFDYVMKTFRLSEKDQMSDEDWEYLQRFVVLLYDRYSTLMSVNKCRRKLFSRGCLVYTIPPTENALKQQIRRAMLQSK